MPAPRMRQGATQPDGCTTRWRMPAKQPPTTMPFKYTADGQIATTDVNGAKLPVFIHADGKEVPFDADSTLGTISRLNGEARSHREKAEAAQASLKAFEGITDPAKALKALKTVEGLDEKQLIAAGDRDKAVQEAVKATETALMPFKTQAEQLQQKLDAHLIGGAFSGSQFVATKIAAADAASAAQIARGLFGQNLKVEDGKVVGYDAAGNRIYSKTRPGELADANEAIETLITTSPLAASILKGANASGGGAGNGGGNGGGKTQITRAAWQALSPSEQRAKATDPKVEIVD
jgi:hypothetical protein